ncbi:type II/IV secretion system ATPase subunit [Methanonatronarchaeum sp. AMET-Sl]|uniref:type II/IV secretion system ATPase subunit n=1 Tax=Methanonatronarchaeum sp. AMET-Sl TaxID=3037654 RepID=UPI00244E3C07|nr:type II/IV secretion system ATPase subunit [Methanonatronarchaeum sp. AMET-Sl]WGI16837.1 type II/IV secretion system ATPase subunit [Methanonatronarchaeum sp. AMET-Sl]
MNRFKRWSNGFESLFSENGEDKDDYPKLNEVNDLAKEIGLLKGKIDFDPSLQNLHYNSIRWFEDMDIVDGYWNTTDTYWLDPGFSRCIIYKDVEDMQSQYVVVEPELTEREKELLQIIYKRLKDRILKDEIIGDKKEILHNNLIEVCRRIDQEIDNKSFLKIHYYIKNQVFGFDVIEPLMKDRYLEDISCNGVNIPIYVYHQRHGNLKTNIKIGEEKLEKLVMTIAQRSDRQINFASPTAEATLPDGSRAQLSLGKEVTLRGSTFTIRKFPEEPITPTDLVAWETLSPEILAYLWLLSENGKNIMVVGGTATGKTTTLNAITLFIPTNSKVVTIEDTHEIRLPFENWVPSITKTSQNKDVKEIGMYDLLRSSLRQRPEYIIVGEVRGEEAVSLFQAMSTGHTSFSTLHASSVHRAIRRLENPPISVPKNMIPALDIIMVQSLVKQEDKKYRRVIEIQEIGEYDPEADGIMTNLLYRWDTSRRKFKKMSRPINIKNISEEQGISYGELEEELKIREKIIKKMVEKDIRSYKQVVKTIKKYQKDKEGLLKDLEIKKPTN